MISEIAEIAIKDHGAVQKVDELAGLLRVVQTLSPSIILEIGCYVGGTIWAFAQVCPHAQIVGVDDLSFPGARIREDHLPLATYVDGNSHDPATRDRVRALIADVAFVFIDGDHSYEGVRKDWEMYSPFARPGGSIAFHDIVTHIDPACMVDVFWRELREKYETQEFIAPVEGIVAEGVLPISSCGIGVVRP